MECSVDTLQFLGLTAVVASPRMRSMLEVTERVARSNATVLIQGESGSGKEVVARALHQMSLRCSKPWVDVSCGALPEHLMESELFGYEKGAFSGADSSKPGLFELAHTGTLFLDEIGELEPKMQVKLLRVLDGTPYYRLGGTRKIVVDVRVLAATNQDLEEQARQGRFRQDLYHRLSQLKLEVPPLRERPEDVLALATYFLERQNSPLSLSPAARQAMENYSWPGNVRELRNLVTRAAILAQGDEIEVADLTLPATSGQSGPNGYGQSPENLDGIERQTILRTLDELGGHRQRTADRLGISRRTLSRKLKQYGVNDPDPAPAAAASGGALRA